MPNQKLAFLVIIIEYQYLNVQHVPDRQSLSIPAHFITWKAIGQGIKLVGGKTVRLHLQLWLSGVLFIDLSECCYICRSE